MSWRIVNFVHTKQLSAVIGSSALSPPRVAMASLCRADFLLLPVVSEHAMVMLSARDIARLCVTSSRFHRASACLVRGAMEAQHALVIVGGTIGDLRALENTPSACSVDLRHVDARRVEHGSVFCRIYVGRCAHLVTEAQDPPAGGDSWSLRVELKKGNYSLSVFGWRNPAHGILDLFCDGVRVTPASGFDWCGPHTACHVFRTAAIHVKWTGTHHLIGTTSRTNADGRRRTRYWMCLSRLKFEQG